MTDKKKATAPKAAPDSNHNTTAKAAPVNLAQVHKMPDYNPMRREGGPANVKSDTSMNEDDNAAVVDAKGDKETVAERDATNVWNEPTPASDAETNEDAKKA